MTVFHQLKLKGLSVICRVKREIFLQNNSQSVPLVFTHEITALVLSNSGPLILSCMILSQKTLGFLGVKVSFSSPDKSQEIKLLKLDCFIGLESENVH